MSDAAPLDEASHSAELERWTSVLRQSLVAIGLLLVAAACGDRKTIATKASELPSSTPASAADASPPPTEAKPELAPLQGTWISEINENGVRYWVALPLGARERRPLIVGIHGAGDRADWACSEWLTTLGSHAFVVCPVGVPAQWKDTFSWGSAEMIATRSERAVAAVKARYADYIAEGPLVYGGWSQGATLASQVFLARPKMFDRVVLVEAGHTPLDASAVAAGLVKGGAIRAVVACSSMPCRGFATQLEAAAKRAKLPVRTVDVGLRGHWFDEPMFRAIGPAFVWSVDDTEEERGWRGLDAAVKERNKT